MEYRSLGRTGISVSSLCLGAMMFGSWGNTDHDECVSIVRRAVDEGINFIDTADVYSSGESEVIVAKALAEIGREDIVLATKVHGRMGRDRNTQGNSRRWIIAECENSLKRLGTDYIDLYQIHRPEPETDIDETLGALTDLVRSGKIRYAGSSTFPAHQVVEAQWVAERRGGSGSSRSNPRTRSSPGPSKPTCSLSAASTGWECSRGARSPAGGFQEGSEKGRTTRAGALSGSLQGTTCRSRATSKRWKS